MAAYRANIVGVVFQSYNLIMQRTALQNVELPLIFSGHAPAVRCNLSHEPVSSAQRSRDAILTYFTSR
jgi:putative ABC transport system ATP-binding protein